MVVVAARFAVVEVVIDVGVVGDVSGCDVVPTVVDDGMVDVLVLEESPPHAPETTPNHAMTRNAKKRWLIL